MENCKANVLVAEDAKQLSKFVPFASELPYLKAVIQWTGQPDQEAKAALERKGRIKVMSWERMLELGRKEGSVEALEERLGQVAINECCHLVYTSGTTGNPKGVMLTHDNLTYTSRRLCEIFHMRTKEERLVRKKKNRIKLLFLVSMSVQQRLITFPGELPASQSCGCQHL